MKRERWRGFKLGRSLDVYASRVLEDAAVAPSIDELLAPVRADFARSGMTEQEIMDLGRRELQAIRQQKLSNTIAQAAVAILT